MTTRLCRLIMLTLCLSLGLSAAAQAEPSKTLSAETLGQCAALYTKHETTILEETKDARTYLPYDYLARASGTRALLEHLHPGAAVPATDPGTSFSVFTDDYKLKKCDETIGFRPVTVLEDTQTPDSLTCTIILAIGIISSDAPETDPVKVRMQAHINRMSKPYARAGLSEDDANALFYPALETVFPRYQDESPINPQGITHGEGTKAHVKRCMEAYPHQDEMEWAIMKAEADAKVPPGICQAADTMVSAARTASMSELMAEPKSLSALFGRAEPIDAQCRASGRTEDGKRSSWYTCEKLHSTQRNSGDQRGVLSNMAFTLSQPGYNLAACPGKADWTKTPVMDSESKWHRNGTLYTSPDEQDSVAILAVREAECGKSLCDVDFKYEIWAGDAAVMDIYLK